MATTHALAGGALAALVAVVAPEYAAPVLLAGLAGGLFPDLDIYAGHRKTLHYPTYYSLASLGAAGLATVTPSAEFVAVTVFFAASALHSVMDAFGGGLELRPWEGRSDRAVYNHALGRWHRPRRWIRYDGAPEDAALGAAFAVPTFLVADGPVRALLAVAVLASVAWVAVRRHVPDLAVAVAAFVPDPYAAYVPERFREV